MRLRLKGNQDVLDSVEIINQSLTDTGTILKGISDKGKLLDGLSRKLKGLTDQLALVTRQLAAANKPGASGGGTGSGSGSGNTANLLQQQQNLQNAVNNTTKSVAQLRKELAGTGQGTQAYNDLVKQIGHAKGEAKLLNDQIREQQRIFEQTKSTFGDYRDLELRLQSIRAEYKLLDEAGRNSTAGKALKENIQALDKELKDIDASIGVYTRNVGNYASAFDAFGTVATRVAAAAGITVGLDEFIQANKDASDAVADVAKTANISIESVRKFQEVLKGNDTRTTLVDQLKIAEIGGQLGVAETQLENFTIQVDKVNVALGDEFGNNVEEVTRVTGGLRNVFKELQTDNVGDDVLKIANALNVLSADGNATAPIISDLANRIGGVAAPLGASAASIFGLSTTLNELNVTAERGGSGVVRILTEIAKAPDKFASIAGVGAKEFRQLVEKDIVGALALVTKKTQESATSNVQFVQTLDELKITGVGELEVFQKLGSSYDLYQKRVQQAGAALKDTASITQEFEKKNQTFGASIDKLKNALVNLTVNTDFQDFLSAGINGITGFINVLAGLPKLISENKTEFIALGLAILAFNQQSIIASIAAIRQSAAYLLLTDATRRQALSQGILNTVTKAGPFLAVIAAVYLAVKAYQTFNQSIDAAANAAEHLKDAQSEIAKETASEASALRKNIEILKNAASSTKQRTDAIEALKKAYPEYLQGMNLEKLSISELTTLQSRLTEEIIRGVAERKKSAALDEIAGKIIDNQFRIAAVQKDRKAATTSETLAFAGGTGFNGQLAQQRIIEGLTQKAKELQDEYAKTSEAFDNAFNLRNNGTGDIAASAAEEIQRERAESAKNAIVNIRKSTDAELRVIDTDAAKEELERRKKLQERLKELADQRLKDEKAAADNIYKLQQDLIKKTFDGRIQISKNDTARAISALVGSPAQIEAQRLLLQTQLKNTIADIEAERTAAIAKALADIQAFKLQAQQAAANATADSANNRLDAASRLSQIDEFKAKSSSTSTQSSLDKQLAANLITQDEYDAKTKENAQSLQRELLEIRQNQFVSEKAIVFQVQQAQLEALNAGYQAELQAAKDADAARIANLQAAKDTGAIDDEAFQQAAIDSDAIFKQTKLDAERKFREDQAEIIQDAAIKTIETETQLAEDQRAIQAETDAQKLESARRTRDQVAAYQNAQYEVLGAYVQGVSALLSADVENRKQYGNILKVLALAEIAINLRKELSAISLAAVQAGAATGPFGIFTAGTIYAAQAATAIVKAAFNAAGVLAQKFEYGGTIPTDQSEARTGGNIPSGSGMITGKPHSQGGVKAMYNNRLVEFEGGEYHLRNGKETYIINRKSTGKFKDTLLRLSDNPNRFSAARKNAASKINSFSGWGRPLKYAAGGLAPAPLDLKPLSAPQIQTSTTILANAAGREEVQAILQLANSALAMASAANNRIDVLQVINDPAETLAVGAAQAAIKQTRNL